MNKILGIALAAITALTFITGCTETGGEIKVGSLTTAEVKSKVIPGTTTLQDIEDWIGPCTLIEQIDPKVYDKDAADYGAINGASIRVWAFVSRDTKNLHNINPLRWVDQLDVAEKDLRIWFDASQVVTNYDWSGKIYTIEKSVFTRKEEVQDDVRPMTAEELDEPMELSLHDIMFGQTKRQ